MMLGSAACLFGTWRNSHGGSFLLFCCVCWWYAQTYVGDILLVVNPYQRYPIYTAEVQKFYMGGQFGKDDLAPHCYQLADLAYQRISSGGNAQTVVIR
jgi:hypothetical protein